MNENDVDNLRLFGHRKEIRELTFRALALRLHKFDSLNEVLTLDTSAPQSLHDGKITF